MIEKFYVTTSAGQIHGRRGPAHSQAPADALPIVLLHRTPVDSASFERMMAFLIERGQPCLAFDTPGFGESFTPSGTPAAADYGRWLLEAIDAAGVDRFHLAAHHTGTHFAAEIAATQPDRVASLTLSGVLFAPPEERVKMRGDIVNAPPTDLDGVYMADTFKLMKSLFLDPDADLIHAETMGALTAAHGRDLAFDAIFAQNFAEVIGRVLGSAQTRVQIVQASDDPLTLTGHLTRFRDAYPQVPVTLTGPAFLATPERQSGAFARALLAIAKESPVMNNRRYELVNTGDRYALQRAEQAVPVPGHGEVLVRVRAVSLNRRDLGVRDLSYPVNGADHFTPLSDAAGEVVAVGDGVTQWQVGDRVMSTFFQNFAGGRLTLPALLSSLGAGGPGVFADHVVLAESGLLPVPEGWTFEEAACLPCAGVTAWSALKSLGNVQKDDTVLVIGTGGVALFALQIAAASGARPIILSSSNDKIARARALGAVDAINYRDTPEWAEEVRKRTQGAGVQHVIELGGVGTLQKSVAALGLGGHLALIGALDGFGGEINAMPLIFSALRISAVTVGSRADHAALSAFMVEHGLKPVIDRRFSFDEAEAAYAHAETGVFGKVVIAFD
jgi:NADPH:quinone reductase-like Zn-dependent oxidoreductase/pimeloyl-ACP methyl ester carboxylesterase